jgi:hypothetical protein
MYTLPAVYFVTCLWNILYVSFNLTETSCNTIGYTWDSWLYICYKYYEETKNVTEAKVQCSSDHPESQLLLVDSDDIFDFHINVISNYQHNTSINAII